jgi:hypothetical protein
MTSIPAQFNTGKFLQQESVNSLEKRIYIRLVILRPVWLREYVIKDKNSSPPQQAKRVLKPDILPGHCICIDQIKDIAFMGLDEAEGIINDQLQSQIMS